MDFLDIDIGDEASFTKTITDEDIITFSEATGDKNPLHLDEEHAKKTRFGRRIAHGMLVASMISSVLANQLPGPGTIYLSQSIRFRKPVYPGDTITSSVIVTGKDESNHRITLDTVCINQNREVVIKGEAVVLYEK